MCTYETYLFFFCEYLRKLIKFIEHFVNVTNIYYIFFLSLHAYSCWVTWGSVDLKFVFHDKTCELKTCIDKRHINLLSRSQLVR